MKKLLIPLFLLLMLGGTGATAAWVVIQQSIVEPVVQPLAFNHKRHAQDDVGLKCEDCHKKVNDTPYATIPRGLTCKKCHEDLKGTNPEEAKLRDTYITTKKEIPWIQVNRLPGHVYFSHSGHVKYGKMDCVECHGNMKEETEPVTVSQIKNLTMSACMKCHEEKKVSNDCLLCHK